MNATAASARRGVRRPALHFLALGGLLLLGYRLGEGDAELPPRDWQAPIVITAEQIRGMESHFRDRWGGPPSDEQRRALINQAVEEELLYRQARLLALEYRDPSVRRRLFEKARALNLQVTGDNIDLVEEAESLGLDDDVVIRRLLAAKMRLVLQQDSALRPISDRQVADYLERNRARFLQPETLTFTHVFLAASARGERLAADAAAARSALGDQPPSPRSAALSDPFPLGDRMAAATPNQVIGRFGKRFADRVAALPVGRWSEPIASPFGLHLVWVERHSPVGLPPLAAVREPILLELTKARAAENLANGLARLRTMYDVRIETAS